MNTKLTIAAAAILAAGFVSSTQAAAVLSVPVVSGNTYDGWNITYPVGISLVSDASTGGLVLEKNAAFDSAEGLDITFTQVSYSASPTITVTDESITNVSGAAFGGFQFLALNTMAGNAGAPTFAPGVAFAGGTAPFTTQTDSSDVITLGGGTLGNTQTAKWGFGATGGDLVIDANPASSGAKKVFDFKEIPVTAVPLPAAAWTGLSGLVGLGLIGSAKRLRRLLA
jgi:hypothetical protein